MNYPIARAHAYVEKSRIKQAMEEVFGEQMDRIEEEVKKGEGGGDRGGWKRQKRAIRRLTKERDAALKLAQTRLDHLTDLQEGGGVSTVELTQAKKDLEKALEQLSECEGREITSAETLEKSQATVVAMQNLAKEVTRGAPDRTEIGKLIRELTEAGERTFAEKIDELFSAITGCKTRIKEFEDGSVSDTDGQAKIAGLRDKIQTLKLEAETAESECSRLLHKLRTEHNAAMDNLKKELATCEKNANNLPSNEKVDELNRQLEECTTRVTQYETEKAKFQELIASGEESLSQLEARNNALDEQKNALEARVGSLSAEVDAAAAAAAEVLASEVAEAKALLEAQKEAGNKVAEAQPKVEEAETQKAEAKQQAIKATQKAGASKAKAGAAKQQADARGAELERRVGGGGGGRGGGGGAGGAKGGGGGEAGGAKGGGGAPGGRGQDAGPKKYSKKEREQFMRDKLSLKGTDYDAMIRNVHDAMTGTTKLKPAGRRSMQVNLTKSATYINHDKKGGKLSATAATEAFVDHMMNEGLKNENGDIVVKPSSGFNLSRLFVWM